MTTGFVCPKCNWGKTSVLETREHDVTLRRRRVCSRCKHRFTTLEIVVNFKFTKATGWSLTVDPGFDFGDDMSPNGRGKP